MLPPQQDRAGVVVGDVVGVGVGVGVGVDVDVGAAGGDGQGPRVNRRCRGSSKRRRRVATWTRPGPAVA